MAAMVPCGLGATPPVTSSFTDSQGLTAVYRYSLKEQWDPGQARGLLMYFHGQSNGTPEDMLTSMETARPLAWERGLVPVVVVSSRAVRYDPAFFGPIPGYGTRYWYPEDARLVHELLQSGLESAISIDYERVFFWGHSLGPCFLSYFLEKYGVVYGGGFYAQCGCFWADDRERAGVEWTPSVHWSAASASALSKRFKVFVQATTEDFLHPESERMYDYYKNTLGLETRADLEAPGGHCAEGAVGVDEALDWLVASEAPLALAPTRQGGNTDDFDGDGIVNDIDTDDDGDGAADIIDAAPLDPREWLDTDADGIGDFADSDADGDGHANAIDAFPRNPREWLDSDGDQIGNNLDPDDDGDGVPDNRDDDPLRGERMPVTVLHTLREGYYGWEASGAVLVAQEHLAMPATFIYPRPRGDRQHYQFITLGDGPGADVQVMVDRFRLARSPAEGSLVPSEYDPTKIDLVYIDRNGNGILTDDGPPTAAPSMASGTAWIDVRYASGEVVPYGIRFHVDSGGILRYRFNSSWLGEVPTPHGTPVLAGAVDRNSDGLFTLPDRGYADSDNKIPGGEHADLLCVDVDRDTDLFCWDYWSNRSGPESVFRDDAFLLDGQFLQASLTPTGRSIHFEFAGFMREGGGGVEPVPAPSIASGGIILADLYSGSTTAAAPGAVASVLGSGFARSPATARGSLNEAGRVADRIFDVCLTVDGVRVPLFYVSEGRITFQVPAETATGTARVEVVVECGTERERRSAAAAVQITPRQPAFLLLTRNPPRILHARQGDRSALPAPPDLDFPGELTTGPLPVPIGPGEVAVLYATGFGATQPTLRTGELAPGRRRLSAGSVRVWLGGAELASDDVPYAGASPGYAGVYELHVRIPERTPPGKAKVVVAIDGIRSRDGPYVEIARTGRMAAGESFRDCAECPEMVVVPAGSFLMGAPETESYSGDEERPVHRVTIDKPFAIGVYEVTFEEWDACLAEGGCNQYRLGDQGWGRERRPVINVRWEDAQAYVAWLSEKTGQAYRLPSEAEWEYAARAWTQTAFSFGSRILSHQANYWATGLRQTLPVGSFEPNAFGLFDMHGNVGEWVQDCWHPSYEGAPTDGSAWETGSCLERIERGGSHDVTDLLLRSAARLHWPDRVYHFTVGFRVAKTLQP